MRILIIDNYDSFTFNLYQQLAEFTDELPQVVRNDEITWPEIDALGFDAMVISPGPGRPSRPADFGVCAAAIRHCRVPLLGVCLGHQGLAQAYGGVVCAAPTVMHGRTSRVAHNADVLFHGVPQAFEVVRYHSLMVARPVPGALREIAWTPDGILMGLRHRTRPQWGLQFHPESIGTSYGDRLLANFVELAREFASPLASVASVASVARGEVDG